MPSFDRWIAASLLALALSAPGALAAQDLADYDYENLQFRGIGPEVGAVWPSGVEPTVAFGLRADMGFVGPHVRIVPAVRYWSSRLRAEEVGDFAAQILTLCERQQAGQCPSFQLGEIDRSDLELSADAHYLFPTGYTIEPYLGGGVSLHLLNGRGEAIDDTFVEDLLDAISPGLDLVGGVNAPIGSLQLFSEARAVLVSDVRYLSLSLGASWTLPSPPPPAPSAAR